jgi:hypothetical protein
MDFFVKTMESCEKIAMIKEQQPIALHSVISACTGLASGAVTPNGAF